MTKKIEFAIDALKGTVTSFFSGGPDFQGTSCTCPGLFCCFRCRMNFMSFTSYAIPIPKTDITLMALKAVMIGGPFRSFPMIKVSYH